MKRNLFLAIALITSLLFSGCIMVIPNTDSIGESKYFEKDGITLLLTEDFVATESKKGFDAYYVSDFCGVMVLKEEFALEEGLEDRELSDYIENVISNNGHTDIEPQFKDGLWYYVKDTSSLRYYSFCYKGSDAFWIVQYAVNSWEIDAMDDLIYLWAQAVEVE